MARSLFIGCDVVGANQTKEGPMKQRKVILKDLPVSKAVNVKGGVVLQHEGTHAAAKAPKEPKVLVIFGQHDHIIVVVIR